jgi:hypothetical protein
LIHNVFGVVAGCDEGIASRKRIKLFVSGFEREDNPAFDLLQTENSQVFWA